MKIWANSGDSHFLEPEDLFRANMPPELGERMPRSEKDPDGRWETVYVDGQSFRRRLPRPVKEGEFAGMDIAELSARPPGARDARARLADLDEEGIWGEVVYPSVGLWNNLIRDPVLAREAVKVLNDWAASEIQGVSPRYVCAAAVSMLDIDDAVAELHRAAGLGFKAMFLPTRPPAGQELYNSDVWEPLWAACEEEGVVVAFHIGTEGSTEDDALGTVAYRGPGGAVLNFAETTYGGQRAAAQMVASGALDRHRELKVLVSEGGATWVPFLGDRMNEAYRQHGMFVRPKLERLPKDILYAQVYASFQHDESAIAAYTAMGYPNVLWGSDYPHLEGTFGHTQKTLHELFDDVPDTVRRKLTVDTFLELFPTVGPPPAD